MASAGRVLLAISAGGALMGSVVAAPGPAYAMSATAVISPTTAPLPPDAAPKPFASLRSVGCGTASSCAAVGAYVDAGDNNNQEALIVTLSGGRHSIEAPPPPDAATAPGTSLNSVACRGSSCAAVGVYQDTSFRTRGLIETLSGGSWQAISAPGTADAGTPANIGLISVSCGAAGSCVAVGGYRDTSHNIQAEIETLSGGVWSPLKAPLPVGAASNPMASLTSVACGTAGSCAAVGTYVQASGPQQGLIETLSGGVWRPVKAPLPPAFSDPGAALTAVGCGGAGSCAAVGHYRDSSGKTGQVVIETLARGSWSPLKAVLPADASSTNPGAVLSSVSCGAVSSCSAVGQYIDSSSDGQGLTETLSSGVWTPVKAPLPPGAAAHPAARLNWVTCGGAGACMAIGSYADSSRTQGLIETLAGGVWTPVKAPLPPGAPSSSAALLSGVSCGAASSCVAVGQYVDSSSTQGLIERSA